jgi:hypothetical protein
LEAEVSGKCCALFPSAGTCPTYAAACDFSEPEKNATYAEYEWNEFEKLCNTWCDEGSGDFCPFPWATVGYIAVGVVVVIGIIIALVCKMRQKEVAAPGNWEGEIPQEPDNAQVGGAPTISRRQPRTT